MSTTALHSTLNTSETVRDRGRDRPTSVTWLNGASYKKTV